MTRASDAPQSHLWDRRSYSVLIDAGAIGEDRHVQLIDGEIVAMSPEKSRHAAVVELVAAALRSACAPGDSVRVQHPLALGQWSEPEPDCAVVAGHPRDHLREHPSTAVLVVEVADSSLAFDRDRKATLYATAGIPSYWIVNLEDNVLETFAEPVSSRYTKRRLYRQGHVSAPGLAREVPVEDLLPER